jgi:hypothetical protein
MGRVLVVLSCERRHGLSRLLFCDLNVTARAVAARLARVQEGRGDLSPLSGEQPARGCRWSSCFGAVVAAGAIRQGMWVGFGW